MREDLNLINMILKLRISIISYKIVFLFAFFVDNIATLYSSLKTIEYNSFNLSFKLRKWWKIIH